MLKKKIITTLIFISVFTFVLQIAEPVHADQITYPPLDDGDFKFKGKDVWYRAKYETYFVPHNDPNIICPPNGVIVQNKKELYISFYCSNFFKKGKDLDEKYFLNKTKKNQIKAYSVKFDKNNKIISKKHLKTYKTTKSLKSFYFKTYKPAIIKQLKKKIS